MNRLGCLVGCMLLAASLAASALAQDGPGGLSAAEIVERNAAARGGVPAWQKLQTLAWAGHTEINSVPGRQMTFLLEQKRPNKTRFEITAEGQRSLRVYDGSTGWKMRPNSSNGRPDVQAYSEEELRFARGAQVIDGPLMDYVAKGGVVTLTGSGQVDGQRAYILDVKLPSGGSHTVWVDAQTFLDVRHDRQVRGASGQMGMVTVLLRDYREFEGLTMPTVVETGSAPGRPSSRLVIERVALNPPLEDSVFTRPMAPLSRRAGVVVDTRGAAAPPPRPTLQP
jgi:outer membrane lipoprotein-sorting protein